MSYAKFYDLSHASSATIDADQQQSKGAASGSYHDDILTPWAWVQSLDELTRSRRLGQVFYNFVEGKIRFPPSYRWARGHHHPVHQHPYPLQQGISGHPFVSSFDSTSYVRSKIGERDHDHLATEKELLAGDFTDIDRLWSAYTTSVGMYEHIPAMINSS